MSTEIRSAGGNPRVSLTAYATASAWVYYGFEHAEWFDTRRGRALFWPMHMFCRSLRPVAPGAGAFTESLYWRHHWFSLWTETQAPGLAVEIGAGLATRGIAHARRHADCRWVDYDLPGMVNARRERLREHTLPENYRLGPGDLLSDDLGRELQTPAHGSTVVLTEGVTDYLDRDEKRRAWSAVATLLARLGGGRFLLEIHPRDRLAAFGPAVWPMLGALRRITGRDLAGQLFADAGQALAMLGDCGFSRARVLADDELDGAAQAPPPRHRAFVLLTAEI